MIVYEESIDCCARVVESYVSTTGLARLQSIVEGCLFLSSLPPKDDCVVVSLSGDVWTLFWSTLNICYSTDAFSSQITTCFDRRTAEFLLFLTSHDESISNPPRHKEDVPRKLVHLPPDYLSSIQTLWCIAPPL